MRKQMTPAIPALLTILAYLFSQGWPMSPNWVQPVARLLFWIFLAATVIVTLIVFWDGITSLIPMRVSKKRPLEEIPEILNKMNKRLTVLVEKRTQESPINPDIVGDDYLGIFPIESMLTDLKGLESTSDSKIAHDIVKNWFNTFEQEINKNADLQDSTRSFLIRLNALMNLKGIGVAKITDSDAEYIKLNQKLEKLRPKMTKELHAIGGYSLIR